MATALQNLIDAYIKRNANQEITGPVLNGVLTAIANALGTPFVGSDGYWYTYDAESGQFVKTDTPAQGETGPVGVTEAAATIDDQIGTPSVAVSLNGTRLDFAFRNLKGQKGDTGDAGITAAVVTVDAGIGTPSVDASITGTTLTLAFHNLKGETGAAAGFGTIEATVDDTTGTPAVVVTESGPDTAKNLSFAFSGLKGPKGDQGNTGVSADYPITIANNLTTDDPTAALAASQGVVLKGEIDQLGQEVNFKKALFENGTPGSYIDLDGTEYNNWEYGYISAYLPVKAGQEVRSYAAVNTDSLAIAFYNESKTYINGIAGVNQYALTDYTAIAPADGFVRFFTDNRRTATAWADSYILLGDAPAHMSDISILPGLAEEVKEIDEDTAPIIEAVEALDWPEDSNRDFVFNGVTSVAVLATPIVLSQDGDSLEIDLTSANGNTNPYGYGLSQSTESSGWRGICATGNNFTIRADDGTWIVTSASAPFAGRLKISYENGNIVVSRPGYNGSDIVYTGQKTISIARFGYSPLIGTTPKYWTGTINAIRVNGQYYDLSKKATLTDVTYSSVSVQRSFLTPQEKAGLHRPISLAYSNTGEEQLRVFVPSGEGFIEYLLARKVDASINLDMWVIMYAYQVDATFARIAQITTAGNWECAIQLLNRDDFAGGLQHGSEVLQSVSFFVDGKYMNAASLDGAFCEKLRIIAASKLYDPIDETTVFADHSLEYIFAEGSLTIRQSINWKENETLGSSFLAMLPMARAYTDHYCSEVDFTPVTIPSGGMSQVQIRGAKRVNIWGQSAGVFAEFGIGDYPDIVQPPRFLGHNNGGTAYNKCYFYATLPGADSTVNAGDVWQSETKYKIS